MQNSMQNLIFYIKRYLTWNQNLKELRPVKVNC